MAYFTGCGVSPAATKSSSSAGDGPVAALSTTQLRFSSQTVNTTSAAKTITLTNTGTQTLSIADISVSGNFAQTNSCGTTLAAGASCLVSVTFTPRSVGTLTGTIAFSDNAAASPQSASLTGTGVAETPLVSLSPSSLTFASQTVGTVSSAKTITLSNTGTGPLSINSIAASGDFAQTNNCGSSVAAGSSCTISVSFAPASSGTRTGALTVTDNAAGGPQSVSLSGTAVAPSASVSLSPASLSFGSQTVGTTSSPQTVTLTNGGSSTLTISGIAATGDFGEANNCGASLAVASSCTISVTFAPTASGARTGSLSVTDSAPGSPQSISLSGTGAAAGSLTASPTSLAFGSVSVGQSSSLKVTLKNTGSSSVTISSVSPSGGDLSVSGITTPLTLSSQQSTTFTVTYAPTSSGSVNAAINVANNGTASNLAIAVTGTGVAAVSHSVSLQWNPSSGAVGYYVLRGTTSGGPYSPLFSSAISATLYVDQSVTGGNTYYYVVTAVGSNNTQSSNSNQVSATIPTP